MQPQYERLTDDQWKVIKHFLNWQRKRKLDLRQIMDAILFITRTGIQWRNLKETKFPDWQGVYYYFDQWKKKGIFEQINGALNQLERLQNDRESTPNLADSQSIKLAPMIFEHRGTDGKKRSMGVSVRLWLMCWAVYISATFMQLPCMIARKGSICLTRFKASWNA